MIHQRWLALVGGAVLALNAFCAEDAQALEFQCVEASRYKYLYQIFGNDQRKFAEYLRVDASKLPHPEVCRAILVTGRFEPLRQRGQQSLQDQRTQRQKGSGKGQGKGQGGSNDPDKLLAMLADNDGWVAELYLASPGGSIQDGLVLGQITRMFWLKTQAIAPNMAYWPDFLARQQLPARGDQTPAPQVVVPPELAAGYQNYWNAVQSFAPIQVKERRCASACTFPHAAGVDRHDTVFVHRGKPGGNGANDPMSDILDRLSKAENRIIAHYRRMDTGEEFVQRFMATPSAQVSPAMSLRTPRYVADLLRARCDRTDAGQLIEREVKLRADLDEATTRGGDQGAIDRLKSELNRVLARRAKVEQCGAAEHEKERLLQFAKYCQNGCNRKLIVETINARLKELDTPRSLQRPEGGQGSSPQASSPQ